MAALGLKPKSLTKSPLLTKLNVDICGYIHKINMKHISVNICKYMLGTVLE